MRGNDHAWLSRHLLLIRRGLSGKTGAEIMKGPHVSSPIETRVQTRSDLAWSIAVGGIGIVAFAAFLLFAWYYAATLFLVFAGILLGVALTAMTHLLQKVMGGPHALRLVLVCVVLAGMLSGVVFLGGATIARQAAVLSNTLKSQLVTVKTFLEQHGVDTSYLELGSVTATPASTTDHPSTNAPAPSSGLPKNLPSAGALASGGGAIVSQTLKLLLGTVSAVGNFFIVLFLGLSLRRSQACIAKACWPCRRRSTGPA
jgi:predicted PurR-regulated permease PerM